MVVLGIVGSPRRNGRTNGLVDAALKGSGSSGVETEKLYLVDFEIKPFIGSGGSDEAHTYCPEELSRLCGEADVMVLGAPVYWGDINGLTKDFMDTVRISNANGKPALGIAIAGGTGKGLLSGIQSIYHFFYHKQRRGIDPTPVSRFNMEDALKQLEASGARLAQLSRESNQFPGETRSERWPEVLAHYANLDYLRRGPVDEFVMLAEQLIKISDGEKVEEAEALLSRALDLISEGERRRAARQAVKSYQTLYYPP